MSRLGYCDECASPITAIFGVDGGAEAHPCGHALDAAAIDAVAERLRDREREEVMA